jgi:hypothetical protein
VFLTRPEKGESVDAFADRVFAALQKQTGKNAED